MTREIFVNGRFLSRRITGVEKYGREILSRIGTNYHVIQTKQNGLTGHAWEQLILPTRLSPNSMLWSPANTGPLFVRNQALTIHDLSPLEHPEWYKKSFATWYRLFLPLLARRVQIIFTPSEYIKQKVMKRFRVKNVIVTPNGVDTSSFCPEAKQHTFDFPRKYIFFVGSIQPRKNLENLMRAWHTLKDDFKDTWLVVAGEAGRVFRGIKFFGDERIRFLNYVSDQDLPGLYANATLFVLPSFDEGFGLPILEAMACGTPVLVSNGGALPETVGDAGMIFDLAKPNDLSESIHKVLADNQLRSTLREKGLNRIKLFKWQATAEIIRAHLRA